GWGASGRARGRARAGGRSGRAGGGPGTVPRAPPRRRPSRRGGAGRLSYPPWPHLGRSAVLRRSIRLPLALGIVLAVLALTLAVAWNVVVVSDLGPVAERLSALHWALLVAGSLFFAALIAGLLLLSAWLVREMRHS